MSPDTLLVVGATMFLMMAIAAFVLTQRGAWRAVLLLVALFGGLNIGAFVWSEILEGWSARRMILFWIAAIFPPLLGVGVGAIAGGLLNWRIANVRPTYPGAQVSDTSRKTSKRGSIKTDMGPALAQDKKSGAKPEKQTPQRSKPLPKPRIID